MSVSTVASPRPHAIGDPLHQRGRVLLTVLTGVIAVAGVAGGVFIALQAGDPEGTGLSILLALIPLPALWLMYWWLDRYEPEPRRYKYAAFVWGGVGAVAISLALEIGLSEWLDLTDEQAAAFLAPPVEETAKGLFFLFTFVRVRRVIDGYIDGLVYAGLIGVGFAFVENIGYYAASYLGSSDIQLAGADGATSTFIVRGVFSPLAHPLFTSALGIAFGLAVMQRSRWAKVGIIGAGWLGSVLMHGMWNASLSFAGGLGFILVYLLLAVLLVVLLVIAVTARSRQVHTLERSLSYMAQRGWIHPAEIPYLSRFTYRAAARRYAKSIGGRDAGKIVKRYQQLGTEVAFLHDAVMCGHHRPRGVERTYALLDRMDELRPRLYLPPAITPLPPQPVYIR